MIVPQLGNTIFCMRTRVIGFIVLGILGLILSECSSADRDESGVITNSGDVSAFEIQVGDCFVDLPGNGEDGNTFSSIEAIPCNQGHKWQMFSTEQLTFSDYSETEAQSQADAMCNQAVQALINGMSDIKFDAFQNVQLTYTLPTYKSWTVKGDRAVDCFIGSDTETYFTSVFD